MSRRILGFVFVVFVSMSGAASQNAVAQQAAATSSAPDFSGAWVGTLRIPEPGERWQPNALRVVFKQSGYTLQGSLVLAASSQTPIQNGRVEVTQFGTSLSFQLKAPDLVMRFELRPDGDMLRGVARVDGSRRSAPIELRRAPAAPAAVASPSVPAPAAPAAPAVVGIYTGNFTMTGDTLSLHAVLTQTGAELTGTVGPDPARQKAITKGKVTTTPQGKSFYFEMNLEKENVVMIFELSQVEAGALKGTVTAAQGDDRVAGTVEMKPLK